jgi:hypothetical protein
MHWLLGKSMLSIESKLLLYKQYSNPHGPIEFRYGDSIQRFQSKTLRSILNAPWSINNHRIHEELQMNTMLSEIRKQNAKYLSKVENPLMH